MKTPVWCIAVGAALLLLPLTCLGGNICAKKPVCDPDHACGGATGVCVIQVRQDATAFGLDSAYKTLADGKFVCVKSFSTIVWNGYPLTAAGTSYTFTIDTFTDKGGAAANPFQGNPTSFTGGANSPLPNNGNPDSGNVVKQEDATCYNYTVTVTNPDGTTTSSDPGIIIDNSGKVWTMRKHHRPHESAGTEQPKK